LDNDAQARLAALVRAHSTPQALVFRCRLILVLRPRNDLLISGSPMSLTVHVTPSSFGELVSLSTASPACKMLLGPVGRGTFPPEEQLEVVNLATSKTSEHDCVASQWSLDDLATVLVNRHAEEAMTRSTIWRVLSDADLKPHRSVYWLNSHDPDFDSRAKEICKLYVQAPMLYQHGELVICCDEKTGMQMLKRKHPTIPVAPGKPEKREQEYIRLGTRCLITSFIVPTGKVVCNLGSTRTSVDFVTHLAQVASRFPDHQRFHWIVDNLNTHGSLEVCWLMARLNGVTFRESDLRTLPERRTFLSNPEHKHVFHYTPKHGSWLNQVELWFSTLARRFLKRGDFDSAEDFEARLIGYLEDHNLHRAHPYRWTYTGQPLVRGTPFCQTRRQQRAGRAWFGRRPQRFDRVLYPPRTYNRHQTSSCSGIYEMAI
jgi:transposase